MKLKSKRLDALWVCLSNILSALLFPPHSPKGPSFPKSFILEQVTYFFWLLFSSSVKCTCVCGRGRGQWFSVLQWPKVRLQTQRKASRPLTQDEKHPGCCQRRVASSSLQGNHCLQGFLCFLLSGLRSLLWFGLFRAKQPQLTLDEEKDVSSL